MYASILYLTSGIRALSLEGSVDKYFFCRFIFSQKKKKEGRDINFGEKFSKTGCRSEFLSKKPKLKEQIV
jgi:hypothetical protein